MTEIVTFVDEELTDDKIDDRKRQVLRQRATWWQGQTYHCPLCDVDFGAAQLAAEHVVREQHPVLRMD